LDLSPGTPIVINSQPLVYHSVDRSRWYIHTTTLVGEDEINYVPIKIEESERRGGGGESEEGEGEGGGTVGREAQHNLNLCFVGMVY
jgi:hypothetical protein